jgi:hypothetical protein
MSYGKIHSNSKDTALSSLDLFKTPDTKTSTLRGSTVEIGPLRNPDGPTIEFEYQTDGFNYVDLQNSLIHVQCKVTHGATKANLPASVDNVKVMPVCNLLHCLFQIVQVSLGDHDIEYEANYPYLAYLESLLSNGEGYKKSIGQSSLWILDKAGVVDTGDIKDTMADDIKARKKLISGGKTVDLVGRLHVSFLTQDRYLPPSTKLKIKLTRSDPNFCLTRTEADDTSYQIEIQKCILLIRQVQVNPTIINTHNSLLMAGNKMKFPINKIDTQMFAISSGKQSERINVKINQQLPKRLFFALIDHEAKNGSLTKDPFNFKHFNLSSIGLDIDGVPFPSKPMILDFTNGKYTRAFYNLAQTTGKAFENFDHAISLENFANGYAVFAFDLTPDQCMGEGVHLITNGTITLDISFKTPLDQTISVFMFAEKDDLIELDQQRVVTGLSRL